jgi:hypothetical protein
MEHEITAQAVCARALKIFNIPQLHFRIMRAREDRVNTKRGFVIGRTNLRTGLIAIDIWTPKERRPKKLSSILRTLCHEIAHHQKKPYRQRYRGRMITRMHFPVFYRQVARNINKLKKEKIIA